MSGRPEPMCRICRAIAAGAVFLWLAAGASALAAGMHRPEDQALRDGIGILSDLLRDPAVSDQPARDLILRAGLGDLTRPTAPADPAAGAVAPPGPETGIVAQALDMRIALTMLTQVAGAEDSRAVLTAQAPESGMRALVIRAGNATLADIAALLPEHGLQALGAAGELVLRVPLVIWEGASLILRPGETLHLSRPDGAFVVNFGHLDIERAAIRQNGAENPHLPRFRPFVVSAGSATFHVRGGVLDGLGFGRTRAYSGFSMLRNNLLLVRQRSFIRDSLFQDLVSVTLSAVSDMEVSGNRFVDARGEGLIVARSPRADIISNIFAGDADFNALQVLDGSADAVVSGNVVLGGGKAGMVIRHGSHRAHVANNIIWHRDGGGIIVDGSDCAGIEANFVLDNVQKGIEVRSSSGSLVRFNHLISNRSAGIWISAQTPAARTFVLENLLHANRSGLATATAQEVVLSGNDFTGQFPRFLSGDVAAQSRHIAADLEGATPLILTASGVSAVPSAIGNCARN